MYRKRLVFWAACIGLLFFGISIITLGSVAAELREKLQLDEISFGTLFSILPFGVLIGSLFFGPIVDKYGYKILLVISCILIFAGFEGIAFSPSIGLLKAYIFLFGIGGGAVNGATNALVADISDKDKGANLSLLGVFYGLGALGMPLISGILLNIVSSQIILASVGFLALITGLFFVIIRFPPPKQAQGFPIIQSKKLIRDKVLLLIGFFLFLQSGFEGIINNWTTTYLTEQHAVQQSNALYALSSFVIGLTGMRLLIGSLFRSVPSGKILIASFGLVIPGLILIATGISFFITVVGLVLLGAGLAGGFPIMLAFAGNRYTELSGTAFSIVFFIAMVGNMIINYGMGIIAHSFGIDHLMTFAFMITGFMLLLSMIILNRLRNNK